MLNYSPEHAPLAPQIPSQRREEVPVVPRRGTGPLLPEVLTQFEQEAWEVYLRSAVAFNIFRSNKTLGLVQAAARVATARRMSPAAADFRRRARTRPIRSQANNGRPDFICVRDGVQ